MNKLRVVIHAAAVMGCLIWGGAGHAAGPSDRPARSAAVADPCGPAVKEPLKLAEAGLRLYRQAQEVEGEVEQAKAFEHALHCYMAAISVSQGSVAKVYHPLGLVYEKLGRYPEAVEALRRFLREVPESQRNVGVTKQINDKLAALKRHVGELDIDTAAGLEVRVDEALVGRAPLGKLVVVTPGTHVVTVGDASVGTLGAEVKIEGGQLHRVDLTAWRPRDSQAARGPKDVAQRPPPPPPGWLVVRSNRTGARVAVDGQGRGVTPLPDLSLGPGAHELEAQDGKQVLRRALAVRSGERLAVELRFPVKPWVWAVVGVAAAAVVATAVGVGVYYGTGVKTPDGPLVTGWN